MSWRDDPNIAAALKKRTPSDVCVLACPACGEFSYYNQGSHFTCRVCDATYFVATEEEIAGGVVGAYVAIDDALTVEDLIDAEFDPELP